MGVSVEWSEEEVYCHFKFSCSLGRKCFKSSSLLRGRFSYVLTFQISQALIFGPPMPNFNKLNFLVLFTKMLGDLMTLVWPKTYMGARQFS